MYNILLVADDLEHARTAARMVGETARRTQASDLCVVVAYPPVPDYLGSPYAERATATRVARAEAVAQELLREVGTVPGTRSTELLEGTAAEVARTVYQARGGDLIVLGSGEPGPWRRLWAGNPGRELADHGLCPVMIVG